MRLGVHHANVSHPGGPQAIGPRIAETARVADQGGAAMVTVMDHWFQMWSPEDGSFDGRHDQLAETVCVPSPLQQPGPPIMIGGVVSARRSAAVGRDLTRPARTAIERLTRDTVRR